MTPSYTLAFATAFAIVPLAAEAHTGLAHEGGGFTAGIFHPLGGPDHLLAMLATGLLAAVIGGRALWIVPLSFLAAMLVGAGFGVAGVRIPLVETFILVSVIGTGALVCVAAGRPVAVAAACAGFFGLFHGVAHGLEAPASGSFITYMAGFTAASALLIAVGAQIGRTASRTPARFTGGAIALAGVGLAALA